MGNGSNISVWYDKWIPWPFRPFIEPMEGLEKMIVEVLIDPIDRTWQLHLLQELFTPVEVENISRIPLS